MVTRWEWFAAGVGFGSTIWGVVFCWPAWYPTGLAVLVVLVARLLFVEISEG